VHKSFVITCADGLDARSGWIVGAVAHNHRYG
jgi:hypothetical protein